MSNYTRNVIINCLSFLSFVFLFVTGLILEFSLGHGAGRLHGGGTGQAAADRLIYTFLGLSRDAWEEVHLVLAFIATGLIVYHLVLHRKWVVSVLGLSGKNAGKPVRSGFRVACFVATLSLVLLPFVISPQSTTRGEMWSDDREDDRYGAVQTAHESETHDDSIRGSMTLRELQTETGVSYAEILEELYLPANTDPDERLGRLKRRYGFTLDTVRDAVRECGG